MFKKKDGEGVARRIDVKSSWGARGYLHSEGRLVSLCEKKNQDENPQPDESNYIYRNSQT